MSRFGPRQEAGATTSSGSRRWRQLLPVVALAAVIVLTGCGPEIGQPYSTISPQTSKADDIQRLYQIIFWASLIVFIAVQTAIGYTALRFRQRGEERPEQVHGSRRLEIAWTIIPAIILLALYIPTAQIIYKHAAAESAPNAFRVDVLGKQWWWEISYPDIPANPDDPSKGDLTTANELILPVGANVVLALHSNNVIHSFWVPQLSGKQDIIPGHERLMQFTADRPGIYWGECAEFCGASHAWMRFKVKVLPQAQFDAWVAAWRTPPADANPDTADVVETTAAFGACLACHRIEGTNAQIAQQGIGSNPYGIGAGPNLTLLACRDTIGAGILENTPQNLETWIKHTDQVKEGVYMPNYYQPKDGSKGLSDEQVAELVKYLESLKPANGCPDEGLKVGTQLDPAQLDAVDQ